MAWQLRCGNQHQWAVPASPSVADTLPTCPFCGQPALPVNQPVPPALSLDDPLGGDSASAVKSGPIDETLQQSYAPPPPSVAVPSEASDQTLPPPPSLQAAGDRTEQLGNLS